MPTTIAQAFQELKKRLEVTGLQKSTISTRQTSVRDVVEADLTVLDSFLTGSYARNTMIAPLKEADIDIFVVLHHSYYEKGATGVLDVVKNALKKTYTRTPDISRNGQAVTVRFEDFIVDVVPAFRRQGGGYLIPNSVFNGWIATDPKRHEELVSAANIAHDGDLIPLIKMIKGWNKNQGRMFSSFHLEVLALHILTNVKITDYPSGMRFFFDKGRELISKKNNDPAGYGDDVGKYLNTQEKISAAVTKYQTAYNKAARAEYENLAGNVSAAFTIWRDLLGDYFPAYGI